MCLGKSTAFDNEPLIYSGAEGGIPAHDNYNEKKDDYRPCCFGVGYPGFTSQNGTPANPGTEIMGPYFKAPQERDVTNDGDDWTRAHMVFVPVDTTENGHPEYRGTNTYMICDVVQSGSGKNSGKNWKTKYCHIGAVKGHPLDSDDNNTDAEFTDGRVTFSVNTTGVSNGRAITNTANYYWRFVTKAEVDSIMRLQQDLEYGDEDVNASTYVADPFCDWSRDNEFARGWKVTTQSGVIAKPSYTKSIAKPSGVDGSCETSHKDPAQYNFYRYAWGSPNSASQADSIWSVSFENTGQAYDKTDATHGTGYGVNNETIRSSYVEKGPWNAAVLRKIEFHNVNDGAIAFAMLDGQGQATQQFTAPATGYYRIECRAFAQTGYDYSTLKMTNPYTAQWFAQPANGSEVTVGFPLEGASTTSTYPKVYQVEINNKKVDNVESSTDKRFYHFYNEGWENEDTDDGIGITAKYYSKVEDIYTANVSKLYQIGRMLSENSGDKYTISVVVKVDSGAVVSYGVKKEQATQSKVAERYWTHWYQSDKLLIQGPKDTETWIPYANRGPEILRLDSCYYDTDIAAFDNVQIYYLGNNDFVLDETKTEETYIKNAITDTYEATSSTGTKTQQPKNTNIHTYLKRSFKLGKWNTLVLPMNLTAAKVKELFGSDVALAKLQDVKSVTKDNVEYEHCINFVSQNLTNDETVVLQAGKFYIIKPTKTPTVISGTDQLYAVGRYNWAALQSLPSKEEAVTSGTDDALQVKVTGTYYKQAKGAPKGSFVISDGQMYRLTSPMDIKGFRGYLTSVTAYAKDFSFGIDLEDEDMPTYIDGIKTDEAIHGDGNIYTISGQLVRRDSTSTAGLPRGLYIVNGRKVFVK